jgi:hypothetical protein
VDIGRQLYFRGHRDATSRYANAIGLFQGNLQMRRFNPVGYFLSQFREEFRDDAISGEALAVFRVEKLLLDESLRVDKEITGPRHAFKLPDGFGVQHPIRLDRLGVGVGKQREINLAAVREMLEDFRVIADRRQLDPLLLESRSSTLQLDQLAFTVRSPVG